MTFEKDFIFETDLCRLVVGEDAIVKSLTLKSTGEETLRTDEEIALFSVTQERPYHNEVKLAHPNKRTTYQANRIRLEDGRLVVGFEIIPYEAFISFNEASMYMTFTLEGFDPKTEKYAGLAMDLPPVAELRLVQLPVKNRKNFGEWLNVSWDETAAVNVLAVSPHARIDSERRKGYRVMTADAVKGIKLLGCTAAVIAAPSDKLMDAIASLEEDFDLPKGVESRRDACHINASAYWTGSITPLNVDEHIAWAKKGGFRMMLIYYTAIFKEERGYSLNGNYDYRDEYPNGREDLVKMLDHIKEAGITPGLHFLQTHIGLRSRYVTPVCDHRINLTTKFTLAKPLTEADTTVYVEEDPTGTVMHPKCRVLRFGGELISYESYSTEYPYCFKGCVRGWNDTVVTEHPVGQMGGILDISEFGASSVYLNQYSDLQDEIADKLADAYNAGFKYVYFDGSEGTNPPFEYHVPNAQYRVYKKFNEAPLYTEGAAKAHFSWHYLSGGNAFDIFPPELFKRAIDEYPAEEAPRMRQDFTRLNFGWWSYRTGFQPDMYEYGTSRAAAWDCPITVQTNLDMFKNLARTDDVLEVMRRWEDVRAKQWLTDEQKEMLKELGKEHILLIDEKGEYELQPYTEITCPDKQTCAFVIERACGNYVVFWHADGEGKLELPVDPAAISLEKELGGEAVAFETADGKAVLPIGSRCYLKTSLTAEEIVKAFEASKLI